MLREPSLPISLRSCRLIEPRSHWINLRVSRVLKGVVLVAVAGVVGLMLDAIGEIQLTEVVTLLSLHVAQVLCLHVLSAVVELLLEAPGVSGVAETEANGLCCCHLGYGGMHLVHRNITALLVRNKHRVISATGVVSVEVIVLIEIEVLMLHGVVVVIHNLSRVHRLVILLFQLTYEALLVLRAASRHLKEGLLLVLAADFLILLLLVDGLSFLIECVIPLYQIVIIIQILVDLEQIIWMLLLVGLSLVLQEVIVVTALMVLLEGGALLVITYAIPILIYEMGSLVLSINVKDGVTRCLTVTTANSSCSMIFGILIATALPIHLPDVVALLPITLEIIIIFVVVITRRITRRNLMAVVRCHSLSLRLLLLMLVQVGLLLAGCRMRRVSLPFIMAPITTSESRAALAAATNPPALRRLLLSRGHCPFA